MDFLELIEKLKVHAIVSNVHEWPQILMAQSF